jgi:hypothetical protein
MYVLRKGKQRVVVDSRYLKIQTHPSHNDKRF